MQKTSKPLKYSGLIVSCLWAPMIATCLLQGFPSKPRSAADGGLLASADAAEAAKAEELRRGLLGLGFAWVRLLYYIMIVCYDDMI